MAKKDAQHGANVKKAANTRAAYLAALQEKRLSDTDPWLQNKLLGLLEWEVPEEDMVVSGMEGIDLVLQVDERALHISAAAQNRKPEGLLLGLAQAVRQCYDRNGLEVDAPNRAIVAEEMELGDGTGTIDLHFPVMEGSRERVLETLAKIRSASQKMQTGEMTPGG